MRDLNPRPCACKAPALPLRQPTDACRFATDPYFPTNPWYAQRGFSQRSSGRAKLLSRILEPSGFQTTLEPSGFRIAEPFRFFDLHVRWTCLTGALYGGSTAARHGIFALDFSAKTVCFSSHSGGGGVLPERNSVAYMFERDACDRGDRLWNGQVVRSYLPSR